MRDTLWTHALPATWQDAFETPLAPRWVVFLVAGLVSLGLWALLLAAIGWAFTTFN